MKKVTIKVVYTSEKVWNDMSFASENAFFEAFYRDLFAINGCGELRRVQQTLRKSKPLCLNNLNSACGEVESCTRI